MSVSPPKETSRPLQEITNSSHQNKSNNKKPKRFTFDDEKENEPLDSPSKRLNSFKKYLSFDKIQASKFSLLNNLPPNSVLFIVLQYLPAEEIISRVQLLARKYRDFVLIPYLWRLKSETEYHGFSLRYRKTHCLVERRSKGKLFKAIDRITERRCTVRFAVAE